MATKHVEAPIEGDYQEVVDQQMRAQPTLTLEEEHDIRGRESQRKLLENKIDEALRDQAEAMKVPFDMWRRLPEADRRELLSKGIPQDKRPEDAPDAPLVEFGDLTSLQKVFAGKGRGMITRDEKKDWVIVCDPVKFDPRWGTYTPGVSKMSMGVAQKKTKPENLTPPFTLEPVAPFPPDPTIRCTMHGSDLRTCTFLTYPDEDDSGVSTLLMDHQQLVHPREYKARQERQSQERYDTEREEAKLDRMERQALMAHLLEVQQQNRELLAQIAGRTTGKE